MPTYEYKCPECHYEQIIMHKMHDMTLPICPNCQKSNMIRGPGGGIAIHFKGSGFYETDYKDK